MCSSPEFVSFIFMVSIFFIKLLITELAENSGIGKLFTKAMESLDEEENDYYFSNSDSA